MRFGLDVAQHQLTWPELLARVRYAEDEGFDGAWVFDHFRPLYGDRKGPCLEGWSLLAALAATTTRVRLGALVTGVTYRSPQMLAMQAITVDVVSNGRLELGLGAAWNESEHRRLGLDFPPFRERARRLEEACVLMRELMTKERASFRGHYYRLEDATFSPKPVQKPHPPFWIGAEGERVMLPIVARQADAWHAYGSVSDLKRKSGLLDDLARKSRRDPRSILRATSLSLSQSMDRVRRHIEAVQELGFGYLVVEWPTEGKDRLAEFVRDVMPQYVA